MDGILNVCKEPGFTSFDVVAKLRGICRQKKIGHTGTLDPDASGVLPVCLGNATKLCDMLTDKTKEYRAVLLLGRVTDTQDTTGKVLEEHPVEVTEEQVRRAVLSFVGEYDQIPPMYSALKVNGQKLCDLARAGREVERKSRRVTIHFITIEKIELPCVTMTVSCSKGTYIRTLCHDIGQALGCGGTMENLVRTRSGQFRLEDAYRLCEIETLAKEGRLETVLLKTDAVFSDLPAAVVKPEFEKLADNGNPLLLEHLEFERMTAMLQEAETASGVSANAVESEPVGTKAAELRDLSADREKDITAALRFRPTDGRKLRIYRADGRFYGVYAWQQTQNRLKPVKMFL